MKVIGLIGGMSWESTQLYYRIVNEEVRRRLGGLHSARCLLYSVDFAEIEALQHAGRWQRASEIMIDAAARLRAGGAECVVICTNTMHRMADEVAAAVPLPLLHIADATASSVRAAGIARVGLLATAFTMEQDFYRGRLERRHGLQVLVPEAGERETVHRVIYEELCRGEVRDESRDAYRAIIRRLEERGAEGIVLGCTEITLLVGAADCRVPVFDTTALHATAAVDFALGAQAGARVA